ncbi:uncharacterized protein [Cicer arietinum]|uniref:uncharacterized protein n=1 Tax=Cicer arietinum TaxID=3827 RepID=UPI003CC68B00
MHEFYTVVHSSMLLSDLDRSQNSKSRANLINNDIGNKLMHNPAALDQRQVLRKSLNHKDLRSYDGYSSHSSVLTDDEGAGAYLKKSGSEKLRAVHVQKKVGLTDMANGLHKAVRKELRQMETDLAAVKSRASTLSPPIFHREEDTNPDELRVCTFP